MKPLARGHTECQWLMFLEFFLLHSQVKNKIYGLKPELVIFIRSDQLSELGHTA